MKKTKILAAFFLASSGLTYGSSSFEKEFLAVERGEIPLIKMSVAKDVYRDYYASPTYGEKQDIRYIVTMLANNSMITLLYHKTSLEKAGDRIEKVHPLQFLLCIFTDEELKAGVHNIRGRSMVWKDFIGGLRESLVTEDQIGNVEPYIGDFAKKLGIQDSLIRPAIMQKRWNDFVDILLKHIPRNDNRNRYDD